MKVLVVGQGGREHALVWKLSQSPLVDKVYCAPGNAGTAIDGENVDIESDDIPRLLKFAQDKKIGLTVVGPEAPLVAGIVDTFKAKGLTVFGPSAKASQMEGSKVFAKRMMKQAGVPTAEYMEFTNYDDAILYIDDREQEQFVIKADGLAAGKGVTVCMSRPEARAAVKAAMVDNAFGRAGDKIIIEECMHGQEASILVLVDGGTIIPLAPSQDHKRALDGDEGPNTGGMGAYSPTPLVTDEMMGEIIEKILVPTIHTMKKAGCPFTGILYAGLMITAQGPKVVEFNVRFGDPEAQPVLMRLKSDLAELLLAAAEGRLHEVESVEWDDRPSVCVVMASEGYPAKYEKGRAIRGLNEAANVDNVKVFHAGTTTMSGNVVNNGGRVLGVTAIGDNVPAAKLSAYQAVKCIRWDGAWCRKDISDKAATMMTGEDVG